MKKNGDSAASFGCRQQQMKRHRHSTFSVGNPVALAGFLILISAILLEMYYPFHYIVIFLMLLTAALFGLAFRRDRNPESPGGLRRSLLKSHDFIIIGGDRYGKIRLFNAGAEQLLGYTAEEMVNRESIYRLLDVGEVAAMAAEAGLEAGPEIFSRLAENNLTDVRRWTLIGRDGSRIPMRVTLSQRMSTHGHRDGFVAMAMKESDSVPASTATEMPPIIAADADSPAEIDLNELELSRIIDAATIQPLMEDFSRLTGMTTAILDLNGKVIVATGWQDICTKFHRCNPLTAAFCTESDLYLAQHVASGKHISYQCKNHMRDVVTPLYIGGTYMGNIFTGQFFYDDEKIDEKVFIAHAEQYGFDRNAYLEALHRVPRFSRERIEVLMDYLVRFTDYISRLSFSNLQLIHAAAGYRGTKEQLQQQYRFLQQLIDAMPNPVFYKDIGGHYLGCNQAFEHAMDMEKENVIGRTAAELYPADEAKIFSTKDRELFATPGVQSFETAYTNRQGLVRNVILNKATFLNPDGTVGGLIAVTLDITERKQVEESLRSEREQLLSIFGSIDEIIYVVDPQTMEVLYANDAAIAISGIDPVGKICHRALFGLDRPCEFCTNEIILHNNRQPYKWEYHNSIINRDYSVIDRLIRWPDGREVKFELAIDITERKRNEEEKIKLQNELGHAQKMESIGRLAGGVAHDFNNMLQVIIGYTDFALHNLEPSTAVYKSLQQALSAARHSSDLTRQLLAFARKQAVNPVVLDLNTTVSGMLKMLRRLIGEDINLVWTPGPDLWPVKIDPSQVDQILANLAVNARDAMPGGGALSIETKNVTIDDAYCASGKDFQPGEYVMLSVADSGCGMNKETMDKLFEPFFTTKELGKGTGLGLSTIFGAVKQNNGFIHVYSEPGHGSTFKIYLPHCRDPLGVAILDVHSPVSDGSETILLTEDDPAILSLGKYILEQHGYTVLTADSPTMAIKLISNYSSPVHLLITDVVMPQMNGKMLRDQLVAMRPDLKVIYMSGYPAEVIAHHGIIDEGVEFIQKPFTEAGLTVLIRKVLDGSSVKYTR